MRLALGLRTNLFLNWPALPYLPVSSPFIFVFAKQLQINSTIEKIFVMLGFDLQVSGAGIDRSANCATTLAPFYVRIYR